MVLIVVRARSDSFILRVMSGEEAIKSPAIETLLSFVSLSVEQMEEVIWKH